MNETYRNDPLKLLGIVIILVALVAFWVISPTCGKVDIAPDNSAVNINGDQRKELSEMEN